MLNLHIILVKMLPSFNANNGGIIFIFMVLFCMADVRKLSFLFLPFLSLLFSLLPVIASMSMNYGRPSTI